ncbi:hypothetical protein CVT26_006600 [Gymnopilus dilepis]|uniref:Protein kinase domain-containing protein n=1 Tax=Gymnopilus dilepis TaxID=231916 RepID=A0A409Y2X8_9AGAR|nr:hypothetical protein CVT26_006600 [Gymnopilus dilepis]
MLQSTWRTLRRLKLVLRVVRWKKPTALENSWSFYEESVQDDVSVFNPPRPVAEEEPQSCVESAGVEVAVLDSSQVERHLATLAQSNSVEDLSSPPTPSSLHSSQIFAIPEDDSSPSEPFVTQGGWGVTLETALKHLLNDTNSCSIGCLPDPSALSLQSPSDNREGISSFDRHLDIFEISGLDDAHTPADEVDSGLALDNGEGADSWIVNETTSWDAAPPDPTIPHPLADDQGEPERSSDAEIVPNETGPSVTSIQRALFSADLQVELIGEGCSGSVYKVTRNHWLWQKRVQAVKLIYLSGEDEDDLRAYAQEVRTLKELWSHQAHRSRVDDSVLRQDDPLHGLQHIAKFSSLDKFVGLCADQYLYTIMASLDSRFTRRQ